MDEDECPFSIAVVLVHRFDCHCPVACLALLPGHREDSKQFMGSSYTRSVSASLQNDGLINRQRRRENAILTIDQWPTRQDNTRDGKYMYKCSGLILKKMYCSNHHRHIRQKQASPWPRSLLAPFWARSLTECPPVAARHQS